MLRKHVQHLLAPTATDGGGGAETETMESDPSGLAGWMKDLPVLEGAGDITRPAQTTEKEPNPNASATAPKPEGGTPSPDAQRPAGDKSPDAAATAAADAARKAAADAAAELAAKATQQKAATEKAEADKKESEKAAAEAAEKKKAGEVDQEKWPRSANDWDKFKAARKAKEQGYETEISENKKTIAKLQADLKTAQETASKAPSPDEASKAEVEQLKKQLDEYSNRIQEIDVTQHPKFQAYFQQKTDAQITLAKRIVGKEKEAEIEKILKLPDSEEFAPIKQQRLEEFIGDLDSFASARIANILNELDGINAERQAEIKKATDHAAELKGQRTTKQQQAKIGAEKLFDNVAGTLGDDKAGMAAYQKRNKKDGTPDTAWNSAVDERIATAKKFFLGGNGVKPESIVRAALHAAAFPAVLEAYKADMSERDDRIAILENQVKELTAAQPNKGGTSTAGPGGEKVDTSPKLNKEMNPFEASRAFVKSMGNLDE